MTTNESVAKALGRPLRERGISLIELMIAMTLGLLVIGAMTTIFINNSQARRELDKSAQQLENGRYAIQLLRDEIALAGFYDTLASVPGGASASAQPCSASLTVWQSSIAVAVENGPFPCITTARGGTDMIFLQRASTTVTAPAAFDSRIAYLQVSLCGQEYASTSPDMRFRIRKPTSDGTADSTTFNLQDISCTPGKFAPVRQYVRRMYFIDRNNVGTDGIPTLKRVQFGSNQAIITDALVEGIEDLHFEYAIDNNADGSPDETISTPSVAQLADIVGVRIWLIARAIEPTPGYQDPKSYQLGAKPEYRPGDNFKRHMYNTYVELVHPVARRTK